MGLDYSYLLYFKKDQLRDALHGVVDIAEPHHPPTRIHFPDKVLSVPLDAWLLKGKVAQYDDPELSFATVLIFDEDEAILDWGHGQEVDNSFRSPPGTESVNRVSIGYIYLTVYNDLPDEFPQKTLKDLVLFDFGTTGTRMSTMFYYSTSIRKTVIEFLEKNKGVCGVFNSEEEGEVFWFKGKKMTKYIDDAYMGPEEVEQEISKR